MSERLGLLFPDGSLLVLPEGTDVDAARREAEEHDGGDSDARTRIVRLEVKITGDYEEFRARWGRVN